MTKHRWILSSIQKTPFECPYKKIPEGIYWVYGTAWDVQKMEFRDGCFYTKDGSPTSLVSFHKKWKRGDKKPNKPVRARY